MSNGGAIKQATGFMESLQKLGLPALIVVLFGGVFLLDTYFDHLSRQQNNERFIEAVNESNDIDRTMNRYLEDIADSVKRMEGKRP